jgi:hypothetical protein
MTLLRRIAAALAAGLAFIAAPASATPHSTDFTDLWFIPSESGWGLNLIQQGNTLFGTLFVYGNDTTARWYVASDMKPQTAPAGQFKFGGKLYQTTGPFFGAASFNPANVQVTEVGDIAITFTTGTTGVLVYNVNTTTVTKNVQRQTFVVNSPAGAYQGGMDTITSACGTSSNNGATATFLGYVQIALNAQNVVGMTMNYFGQGNQQATCTFTNGTLVPTGRLASITGGSWTCAQGGTTLNSGTFTITNLDVQVAGLTANIVATDQFCTYTGRFGGLRTVNN